MAGKVHWRRLTTQIAIMSLVFQAVMAALMLPMPLEAAGSAKAATPSVATVVICMGTSFQLVASGEDGRQSPKHAPGKLCPICDGIATSAFLLETAQTALIGRLTNPTVLRPSEELRPASIACLTHNNRGPPVLA